MHDIEPYYRWQDEYIASEDERSPFFGQVYSEFTFTKKIYNYFIHPQWDEMGSKTLYLKILFVDYTNGYAIIELIGEWNDCLYNDIMYLKREIADHLAEYDINKYILLADNVLNYHADDSSYYEEWFEDILDDGGWICLLNLLPHVEEEMRSIQIHYYVTMGERLNDINWRKLRPVNLFYLCDSLVTKHIS